MRCFIAAWPDESTRLALAALSADLRQRVEHRRCTDIDNLHLTLAFIATIAEGEASAVARELARLRFEPFAWQIDTVGFFAEAGVVWAGTAGVHCKPLLELAQRSRHVLDQLAIDYDHRPLSPHVTLMRGVKNFASERIAPAIDWRVDSIGLYRSTGGRAGSRYSRVS